MDTLRKYWKKRKKLATTTQRWLTGGIPTENCLAAYEPSLAANLAASYINLHKPGTNDATIATIAPGLGAAGWILSGTEALETALAIGTGNSAIAKCTFAGGVGTLFGASGGGHTFGVLYDGSGGTLYLIYDGISGDIPGNPTPACIALTPTGGYVDAVKVKAIAAPGAPTPTLWIGALNNGAGGQWFYSGTISSLYVYDIDVAAFVPGLYAVMP